MTNEPKIIKNEEAPSGEIEQATKVVDTSVVAIPIPSDLQDDHVSISLKYYMHKAECFSDWQPKELKAFSGLIEKLRSYKWPQIQSAQGPTCHKHQGGKKVTGYSRPAAIGEDIPFYGIHINQKARMHGFHFNSVFYLVWLDRNHNYHS